jgi:DNA-binding response OmpR family regulator
VQVLVLEDDVAIQKLLAEALHQDGHEVVIAGQVQEAWQFLDSKTIEVALVDVALPEGPEAGFEFVRALRERGSSLPILLLTARDTVEDRIHGLDIGADDYLVKPFDLGELYARIRAVLRRQGPPRPKTLERNNLRVDWEARAVYLDESATHLTAKEYGILAMLAGEPGHLYTREEILAVVWGKEFEAQSNVVDVYVRHLRKKLGEWTVETVRGIGYRFPAE